MQVAYHSERTRRTATKPRTNHHQLKASTVGQPDRRLHISLSHTTSENRPPSQQITDTPIPHPPITSHHGGDGDGVHPLALPRAPARSPPAPLPVSSRWASTGGMQRRPDDKRRCELQPDLIRPAVPRPPPPQWLGDCWVKPARRLGQPRARRPPRRHPPHPDRTRMPGSPPRSR